MSSTDEVAAAIAARALNDFLVRTLIAAGMTATEAASTAAALTAADLRGVHTHGAVRLGDYIDLVRRRRWISGREPRILRQEGCLTLLDGGHGVGPYVATRAMEKAIAASSDHGAGWVWLRNGGHFGSCAYYATMAADFGMIGLAMTSSSPAMAPWGAIGKLLGSNPWAVAIPRRRAGWPLVLDISNTMGARGRVKAALVRDERLEVGWAITADGAPTRDPGEAIAGSMLPFGAHKGYAIAFMIGALVSAPSGSALPDQVTPPTPQALGHQGVGQLFIAVDVSRIVGAVELDRHLDAFVDLMHAAGDGVVVPGEPEERARKRQMETGITLPHHVWSVLRSCGADWNVELPSAGPDPGRARHV